MFLHRWSKLSQILRMFYCSSCRPSLLPSREISRVRWGDRFPCSILALGNRGREVWSRSAHGQENTSEHLPFARRFYRVSHSLNWAAHTNNAALKVSQKLQLCWWSLSGWGSLGCSQWYLQLTTLLAALCSSEGQRPRPRKRKWSFGQGSFLRISAVTGLGLLLPNSCERCVHCSPSCSRALHLVKKGLSQ